MGIRKEIRTRVKSLLEDNIVLNLDGDTGTAEPISVQDHYPIQEAKPRLNLMWGEETEASLAQALSGERIYQASLEVECDYFGYSGGDFRDFIVEEIIRLLRENPTLPKDGSDLAGLSNIQYNSCGESLISPESDIPYIQFTVSIEVLFCD